MESIVNVSGGNPGGSAKYFLNDDITMKKLKAAAERDNMVVNDKNGSKTIDFSTGAYVSVVLPLVKLWQELEGHSIDPEDVDGMDIAVVKYEIERDLNGTIVFYLIELKVQGVKVKVTCYDTTLSILVQSGKMLEDYCTRVLLPYLRSEIRALGKVIDEKNYQVRAHGEPRTTRQQQKEGRKGAASLEPPSTPRTLKGASLLELPYTSRTPRLLAYSSPVPRILPLTLLPPDQVEEEVLHTPVRQVLALPPAPRSKLQEVAAGEKDETMEGEDVTEAGGEKDMSASEKDVIVAAGEDVTVAAGEKDAVKETEKETAPRQETEKEPLEQAPDAELEARFGLLEAIITSQSQTLPEFSGTINLDANDTELCSDDETEDMERIRFACHKCKYEDKSADALLAHKKTTHTVEFLCQICESEIYGKDHLNKHIAEHQTKNALCETCGECCTNTSTLQKHILSKHCMYSNGQVNELLKMHLELLNTLLTKQSATEQIINQLVVGQEDLANYVKSIKTVSSYAPLPPSNPMPPSNPLPSYSRAAQPQAPLARAPQAQPPLSLAPPPQAPQSQDVAPLQQIEALGECSGKKISWIADSIGHNIHFEEIEKVTGAKIKKRKAYGSVKASGQKFPDANFTDVVPQETLNQDVDFLVMQASSVDLTNLPADASEEYARQTALISSSNMVTAARTALRNNPKIKKVIVMQTTPRYDSKHNLNIYAQEKLEEAVAKVQGDKIVVGKHTLACEDGGLRASRFGDVRKSQVDGIHLKGSSGRMAYTRSVGKIFAAAGLISPEDAAQVGKNLKIKLKKTPERWNQVENGRRPRQPQQLSTFQVATQNRFGVLQDFC